MGVTRPDSSARIKGEVVQPVSPGDDRRGAVHAKHPRDMQQANQREQRPDDALPH